MSESPQGPGLAGDRQIPAGSRDLVTAENLRKVVDQVRLNGQDLLEQLLLRQVVTVPRVVGRIRHEALVQLRQDLDKWSPAQFLRRVNKTTAPTATDMYRAILGYVDDYIENEEKEWSAKES